MIHDSRISWPGGVTALGKGSYILYWMQQSQRAVYNHALEFAVAEANARRLPVMVVFGLTGKYPEANLRHYAFMMEGLEDTQRTLRERGIPLHIEIGSPQKVALKAASGAALLVCDKGYLHHQIQWRRSVASKAPCPVAEVESDAVVPVAYASAKAEYAARTLRPKLHRQWAQFLKPLKPVKLLVSDPDLAPPNDLSKLLDRLNLGNKVPPVSAFLKGGHSEARRKFRSFVKNRLPSYAKQRNRPDLDAGSMMSPYLHFGHISPLEMALSINRSKAPDEDKNAFLEELIVRRELAFNHVFYRKDYDNYRCLPNWARKTLEEHSNDLRDPLYTVATLESARTHDPYWNAAMNEMKYTGYMHNYMRMYWGKKILQWRPDPQDAFRILLALNNKYFIDGRDANSYAGVAWIFGLHDQAWKERPIFGKVRYMARSGLDRKFDMQGYIEKVENRINRIINT